jgi:D-glycero-alpha-D-manno-heptose-7-phosphate kinase
MIISRTPFRISFVGGGTDLRSFYSEEPGQVISTSIDKYIYVVVKRQIGIVEFKYRINWSQVEFCNRIEDIEHPIVRETLKLLEIDFPIEITTFADVPANTGLGSSSAFAVGLVHALHALKGEHVSKYVLASEAAHIEVDVLGRVMGKQDHFAAAYGNLNVFTFHPNEVVTVNPVFYSPEVWRELQQNLLLFYTKVKRDSSNVLRIQEREAENNRFILRQMKDLVSIVQDVLSTGKNLNRFGEILHQNWEFKRTLADGITSSPIDIYYEKALKAGAIGGKLLGAGGGGFLLFYVKPQNKQAVIQSLSELFHLEFGLDSEGTRITYYDQTKV